MYITKEDIEQALANHSSEGLMLLSSPAEQKAPGTSFDAFMEKYWKHIVILLVFILLAIYLLKRK